MRLSRCPYVFYKRALIGLMTFLVILMLTNVELTVEPAVAIFLVSLAMLARTPLIKLTLVLLAPAWMMRFIFSEWDGLIFRTFASAFPTSFFGNGFIAISMICVFSLYILPFLFALVAILRDTPRLQWAPGLLNSRKALISTTILFSCFAAYLSFQPTFDQFWQREVHVVQSYYTNSGETEVFIKSPEYFNNLSIQHGGRDTLLNGGTTAKITPASFFDTTWVSVERTEERNSSDSTTDYNIRLKLTTVQRPYTVTVTYTDGGKMRAFETPWLYRTVQEEKRISWYSFPDTSITIPVQFQIPLGDSVKEKIEVTFNTLAYPMTLEQELSYVTPRTKYISNYTYGR
jgi:hypothetical protein